MKFALPRCIRLTLILLCTISALNACVTQSQSFWTTDRIAELRTVIERSDFDRAQRLLDRYEGTLDSNIALDLSILEGNVEGVRQFVMRPKVNSPLNDDGVTPLIRAVQDSPREKREDIVRLLLDAGADPKKTDNFGRNAINYAAFAGAPALAAFLESRGTSYYSSKPAQRTAWLPEIDFDSVLETRPQKTKGRRNNSQKPAGLMQSKSPLEISGGGRPDLLFASTWIPKLSSARYGPYAGLRFHADGTGEVMRFFPKDKRMESRDASHLAWDFHRDSLYFVVLTERYAAYCHSVNDAPGRFGVSCVDYAAVGGNIAAALNTDLSNSSAKVLLNDASARARLQEVGKTRSVLEPAVDKVCRPKQASAQVRRGAPANAADPGKFGNWVLFDAKRFTTYSTENALVCSQRDARRDAFDQCRSAGGSCRSVGGCLGDEATAVASVQGHGWAWKSCHKSIETAKAQALAECRKKSGCNCQVVYAAPIRRDKPLLCRRG